MKPQKNIITLTITTRTRRGRLGRIYILIKQLISSVILEMPVEFTRADVHGHLRDKLGLCIRKYIISNELVKLRNAGRIENVPHSAWALAFPRTYAYRAKPAIAKELQAPPSDQTE